MPYFSRLTVVPQGDCIEHLPLVPPLKLDFDSTSEARNVSVNLLDIVPWRSTLWEMVTALRISHRILQADDGKFSDLLKRMKKEDFPTTKSSH